MTAAGGAASLGLMFGSVGGNIFDLQLSALQKDGKLNILSSPSITTTRQPEGLHGKRREGSLFDTRHQRHPTHANGEIRRCRPSPGDHARM